jgi:hypothetical protein
MTSQELEARLAQKTAWEVELEGEVISITNERDTSVERLKVCCGASQQLSWWVCCGSLHARHKPIHILKLCNLTLPSVPQEVEAQLAVKKARELELGDKITSIQNERNVAVDRLKVRGRAMRGRWWW